MIRINIVNPEKNETKKQICYHNLTVADQYHNLGYFIAASQAWLKHNPTKIFQDLEKMLRKNNFNTHLYAKPVDTSKIKLSMHKKKRKKKRKRKRK